MIFSLFVCEKIVSVQIQRGSIRVYWCHHKLYVFTQQFVEDPFARTSAHNIICSEFIVCYFYFYFFARLSVCLLGCSMYVLHLPQGHMGLIKSD